MDICLILKLAIKHDAIICKNAVKFMNTIQIKLRFIYFNIMITYIILFYKYKHYWKALLKKLYKKCMLIFDIYRDLQPGYLRIAP